MQCFNRPARDAALVDAVSRFERALRAHHAGRPSAWAEKVRDCLAELEVLLARRSKDSASTPVLIRQAGLVRQDAERIVKLSPHGRNPAKDSERKRLTSQFAWVRLRGRGLLSVLHDL